MSCKSVFMIVVDVGSAELVVAARVFVVVDGALFIVFAVVFVGILFAAAAAVVMDASVAPVAVSVAQKIIVAFERSLFLRRV